MKTNTGKLYATLKAFALAKTSIWHDDRGNARESEIAMSGVKSWIRSVQFA